MNNPLMQLFGNMPQSGLTELIQLMQSGGNPQTALQILGKKFPQMQTILPLLGNGNMSMEQLCRTLCKQKGVDFDTLLAQAQQTLKNK